ncbi:MAG: polysaccharide deacetylase family protein [Steroidobacteraceae bacterium]
MKASALLHLGAAASLAAAPRAWPWIAGAVIADHLVLAGSGLAPRSSWLGPNLRRLPAGAAARGSIAVTIDDGPDPQVTPRVLERLAEHGARATFFCIGERVERFPELAHEIARRGHAVENHSQRHLRGFPLLPSRSIVAEIAEAQATIARVCGSPPGFFRAPAGLRSPLLEPQLVRLGLKLASWTRRGFDSVSRSPEAVLARLTRGLSAGDILLLHDGGGARTAFGQPVILEVLPRLLDAAAEAGLTPVTLRAACNRIECRVTAEEPELSVK